MLPVANFLYNDDRGHAVTAKTNHATVCNRILPTIWICGCVRVLHSILYAGSYVDKIFLL